MGTELVTPTPMREATTNTLPRFALPAGSCDTHFHVFEPGYPSVSNPQYNFPDGTIEQYLALCEFLGIDRMVLVQPTYYGDDNTLTLDTLKRIGSRCRAVVRVTDNTTSAELDRYHAAGVRAIRLDLFARREWPIEEIVAYIRRMALLTEPRGWHLQFYTPGTIVRDLLPFLADFESTYCIDHMGYMLENEGLTGEDFKKLLRVLEYGRCWIKLSGPYRIAKYHPLSHVAPLGRALVETRPDRLIWGSDWPHLTDGQRDTGELINLLADWAPDPLVRKQILVDGPERLFFYE